jgi:hypothetical protein
MANNMNYDYDDYLERVKTNRILLKFVPENCVTDELLNEAAQWGENVNYLPEEMVTEQYIIDKVIKGSIYFGIMDDKYKTQAVCNEAVKNGYGYGYNSKIPDIFKTQQLYNCMIMEPNSGWTCGSMLEYVPDEFITAELCNYIADKGTMGWYLGLVPEQFKDFNICMKSVEQEGLALKFVPQEFHSYDMYKVAMEQNVFALTLLPDEYINDEFCGLFVKLEKIQEFYPELDGQRVLFDSEQFLGQLMKIYEYVRDNGDNIKGVLCSQERYDDFINVIKDQFNNNQDNNNNNNDNDDVNINDNIL